MITASGLNPTQLKQGRRHIIQFVYQLEVGQQLFFQPHVFSAFCKQMEVPAEIQPYVQSLSESVLSNLKKIDVAIEKHTHNWKLARIAKVDLAILRVCVYEMRNRQDVSPEVIIADAVEIAKLFGSENSGGFVNGILDAISRHTETPETGA